MRETIMVEVVKEPRRSRVLGVIYFRQGGSGTCIMKSAERASYGSEEDWS